MIEIVEASRLGRKPAKRRMPTQLELAAEIKDLVRVLLTCGDESRYPFEGVVARAQQMASEVESQLKPK